jgi:hypothetical protein
MPISRPSLPDISVTSPELHASITPDFRKAISDHPDRPVLVRMPSIDSVMSSPPASIFSARSTSSSTTSLASLYPSPKEQDKNPLFPVAEEQEGVAREWSAEDKKTLAEEAAASQKDRAEVQKHFEDGVEGLTHNKLDESLGIYDLNSRLPSSTRELWNEIIAEPLHEPGLSFKDYDGAVGNYVAKNADYLTEVSDLRGSGMAASEVPGEFGKYAKTAFYEQKTAPHKAEWQKIVDENILAAQPAVKERASFEAVIDATIGKLGDKLPTNDDKFLFHRFASQEVKDFLSFGQ